MQSYSLFAPAKINLHLEIIGDRPDGYHELVMIMQSVNLGDIIHLRANGTDQIRLFCDHPQVPLDRTNLVYKAVVLMQKKFPQSASNFGGLDITIEKHIPVAAGLAGGSSNGAAVLVGLNLMWSLGLTQAELRELGALLGSDVPFCISGGTALATGRGEKIEPLPDLKDLWVILAKYDNLAVSTPWAYNTYRQKFHKSYISSAEGIKNRTHEIHSGPLVKAITHHDFEALGKLLYNDLEKVVLPEYPMVEALINAFKQENTLGVMMSGSGPTVFALCATKSSAETIVKKVEQMIDDENLHCWIAQVCPHGIIVNN